MPILNARVSNDFHRLVMEYVENSEYQTVSEFLKAVVGERIQKNSLDVLENLDYISNLVKKIKTEISGFAGEENALLMALGHESIEGLKKDGSGRVLTRGGMYLTALTKRRIELISEYIKLKQIETVEVGDA